jgi:hypothetical protein
MVTVEQFSLRRRQRDGSREWGVASSRNSPADTIIDYTSPGLDEDRAVLVVGGADSSEARRLLRIERPLV